jgi:hypothetical protein
MNGIDLALVIAHRTTGVSKPHNIALGLLLDCIEMALQS